MNISFKKVWIALVSILCIVLITGSVYVYVNYKVINGKLVSVNDVLYTEYEQSMQQSYDSGDVDAQVEYAEKLVSISNPEDITASLALAQALLNKGSLTFQEDVNADRAIEILEKILITHPNSTDTLSALGYAYEIKEDYNKAFEYYNKALSINNEDDTTFARRGHAYELTGEKDLAESDYIKAYELNPKNEFVLLHLARYYYGIGEYTDALEFANLVLDVSEHSYAKAVASEVIGQIALHNDDYVTAQEYFDYSISLDETYPGPYLQYAYVNIINSETATSTKEQLLKEAEDDITDALSLYPESSFAYVLKGLIFDQRKNSSQAKEYYRKALAMVEGDITYGVDEKEVMRQEINKLLK